MPSKLSCSGVAIPEALRVAVTVCPDLVGTETVKSKLLSAGRVSPASAVIFFVMLRLAGAASASRPLLP